MRTAFHIYVARIMMLIGVMERMDLEIIEKVKEAEATIDQLQEKCNQRKDAFLKEQQAELEAYKEQLSNSLKKFEFEQDTLQHNQIDSANVDLDHQVSQYRQSLMDTYQQAKDELLNLGIREVLAKYGNFSDEARSNHRTTSE